MKYLLAGILILSFVSVAVFGFAAMNHNDGHGGCLAETSQAAVCPGGSVLDFVSFHLNAFKSFSAAVFGQNILSAVLLLIVSLFIAGFGILVGPKMSLSCLGISSQYRQCLKHFSTPQKTNLIYWLALQENSPNFS